VPWRNRSKIRIFAWRDWGNSASLQPGQSVCQSRFEIGTSGTQVSQLLGERETYGRSAGWRMFRIYRNQMVDSVHKGSLMVFLSKLNPIHIHKRIYLRWTLRWYQPPSQVYAPPSGLHPSAFPSEVLYALSFYFHATCGAHLLLLYFSVQTVSGESPWTGFLNVIIYMQWWISLLTKRLSDPEEVCSV
jgi:hypothetical protein